MKVEEESVGVLGELAPSICNQWDLRSQVFFAELSIQKLVRYLPKEKKLQPIPRFPAVERDLALIVDETVRAGEIAKEIKERGKGLIRQVELFDLFRGGRIPKGKKNIAFRIVYQSLERTLLSEEVQQLHNRIAADVIQKFQALFQK